MKTMHVVLAGVVFAGAAVAQDDAPKLTIDHSAAQIRVMSLQGSIMGKTVKGAPYSGTEISESTQMLADGTRIHNETQTQVFRDSEGRIRRENGNDITIWDPVANATWALNTKNQTARKLPLSVFYYSTKATPGGGEGAIMAGTVTTTASRPAAVVSSDEKGAVALADDARLKMKMEVESQVRTGVFTGVVSSGPGGDVMRFGKVGKANSEPIGKRSIEGVMAEGTKSVSTIEAGTIGNDRPIQSVTERWYSSDLQTVMLTRTTDPRMGEEVFKLVNVNRSEPAAYLFQVPSGYQVTEQK